MSPHRVRLAILGVLISLSFGGATARAGTMNYTIDILSTEFYPELRDAWMTRINNNGVAAGYIATASARGPYLPTSYNGGGRFQPFGNQSFIHSGTVNAFNDHGDAVGTLNYDTPYFYRGGVVSNLVLPTNFSEASLENLNNNGLAAGFALDNDDGIYKVFTAQDGAPRFLSLGTADFPHFIPITKSLSDAGLLGVEGYSADFDNSRRFLYDTTTATLIALAVPSGFDGVGLVQITGSGLIIGVASSATSDRTFGFWNADGTFRDFLDTPAEVQRLVFNNLGQAIALDSDKRIHFYDGATWSGRTIAGLGDYQLQGIDDFNDRGEFVGLASRPGSGFSWGFVARPTVVPEPGTLLLTAIGLIGLGLYGGSRSRAAVRRVERIPAERPGRRPNHPA